MMRSMQANLIAWIEDPKKRKRVAIVTVVIVVLILGFARYVSQGRSDAGEILRGDAASGSAATQAPSNETTGLAASGAQDASAVIEANTGNGAAANGSNLGETGAAANGNNLGEAGALANGSNLGEVGAGSPPIAVFVDVGGAVVRTGVIALPPGSRITDAIEAAGGLTEAADVSLINRAQVVADGDKLYIPTTSEVENGLLKPSVGLVIGEGGISGASAGGSAIAPGTSVSVGNAPGTDAQGRVNLNTADAETLQLLNGVGPATAQKIIDYRSAHGQFKRIEDIMNVSGIGTKTFEKLKDRICV